MSSSLFSFIVFCTVLWCMSRFLKFYRNLGATSKFHVPEGRYEAISILMIRDMELPMSATVIWCFLLGGCELIHIFVRRENCSNYVENIRHHLTKFSCSENTGHHHKNLVSLKILGFTIQNSATPKIFRHHHTRCSCPENIRHHHSKFYQAPLICALLVCVHFKCGVV